VLNKKIYFQRIIELFTQKVVTKLSKIWVWYPRSGIRKKPILDPGVKKAPDPGSAPLGYTMHVHTAVGGKEYPYTSFDRCRWYAIRH
jgi:hypothetical protein